MATALLVYLTTGCTAHDPADEDNTSAAAGRAIVFSGHTGNDAAPSTRADDTTLREQLVLQQNGFRVYASKSSGEALDLMYNQLVTYHEPIANSYPQARPYWEYTPLKYWPDDISLTRFYAFSPADTPAAEATIDGKPVPQLTYTLGSRAADIIDLLYAYEAPTTATDFKLHFSHALCRVALSMKLAAAPAEGTTILLESLTLTATSPIAQTGLFTISGDSPTWSGQTYYDPSVAALPPLGGLGGGFTITNHLDDATAYAYLHNDVAYAWNLSDRWQQAPGLTTTAQNILTLGDYPTYLYLIPQDTDVTFAATLVYRECQPAKDTSTKRTRSITEDIVIPAEKLKAGTTIPITLTLTL